MSIREPAIARSRSVSFWTQGSAGRNRPYAQSAGTLAAQRVLLDSGQCGMRLPVRAACPFGLRAVRDAIAICDSSNNYADKDFSKYVYCVLLRNCHSEGRFVACPSTQINGFCSGDMVYKHTRSPGHDLSICGMRSLS